MTSKDEFLRWRGVQNPCLKCGGSGTLIYGSTATWRGGLGGAAMTRGVCDVCWGSGNEERHWMNLRRMEAEENQKIAERASTYLFDRLGIAFKSFRPGILEFLRDLKALGKKRKKNREVGYGPALIVITELLETMIRDQENLEAVTKIQNS